MTEYSHHQRTIPFVLYCAFRPDFCVLAALKLLVQGLQSRVASLGFSPTNNLSVASFLNFRYILVHSNLQPTFLPKQLTTRSIHDNKNLITQQILTTKPT